MHSLDPWSRIPYHNSISMHDACILSMTQHLCPGSQAWKAKPARRRSTRPASTKKLMVTLDAIRPLNLKFALDPQTPRPTPPQPEKVSVPIHKVCGFGVASQEVSLRCSGGLRV